MRTRSNISLAATLFSILTCVVGCEGVVEPAGTPNPPSPSAGSGGATPPAPGASSTGTGGNMPAPVIDAGGAGGTGGTTPVADAGPVGTGGSVLPGTDGGAAGAAGGTASPCGPYPTAPELTATRFEIGTVVPNLSFTKEDGKTVTFADIRCNKQNKLMYWAVGGDNCGPCVANAKMTEIPAWRELGPKGLMIVESFNGDGFLVSASPWKGWRTKTMWPPDDDHILVVAEPKTPPWYVMARVYNGIPWVAIIELETMRVVNKSRGTVAGLTTLLNATAERPK